MVSSYDTAHVMIDEVIVLLICIIQMITITLPC